MVYTKTIMEMAHFHDFYFLQALEFAVNNEVSQNPERGFLRSVEKLQEDIAEAQNDIYPKIALRTFLYLYVACLGEARHANDSTAEEFFIPETVQTNRAKLYTDATDYFPTEHNIETLVRVFDQKWSSGFGGGAWKAIAEALYSYKNQSNSFFIDHVVDLEHNNGTAFSKSDAKETIKFDVEYEGHFRYFLDYKFSKNILEKSYRDTLKITPRVYKLIERYSMIFGKRMPYWVEPSLVALDDYYIYWNHKELHIEKKWKPNASVQNGNHPLLSDVYEMLGFDDLQRNQYTFAELKKSIQPKIKKAKETLAPYYKKSEINEQNKDKIDEVAGLCKKAAEYWALPVSVKNVKSGPSWYVYEVIVKVNIKGFGKRVPAGRMVKYTSFDSDLECKDGMLTADSYGAYLNTPNRVITIEGGEILTIMGGS